MEKLSSLTVREKRVYDFLRSKWENVVVADGCTLRKLERGFPDFSYLDCCNVVSSLANKRCLEVDLMSKGDSFWEKLGVLF